MPGHRRTAGRALGPEATAARQRNHYARLAAEAPTPSHRIRVLGDWLAAIARRGTDEAAAAIADQLHALIDQTTEGARQ